MGWSSIFTTRFSMNLLSSVPVVQSHTTKIQAENRVGQVTEHKAVIAHPLLTTLAGTEQVVIFNQGLITAQETFHWKNFCGSNRGCKHTQNVSAQTGADFPDGQNFSSQPGLRWSVRSFINSLRIPPVNSTFSIIWEKPYTSKQKFTNIIHYERVTCTDSMTEIFRLCQSSRRHTSMEKAVDTGHGQNTF